MEVSLSYCQLQRRKQYKGLVLHIITLKDNSSHLTSLSPACFEVSDVLPEIHTAFLEAVGTVDCSDIDMSHFLKHP